MDQTDHHRERVQGHSTVVLARAEDPVFEAAVSVLRGEDYQVVDVDRESRRVRFTCRSDASTVGWSYQLTVESAADLGTVLEVLFESPTATAASRAERRLGRRTARRVRNQVEAAVRQVEPTAAEAKQIEAFPGAVRGPLAGLTRRRTWLAALALPVIYTAPLLAVWLVGRAAGAGLLPDATWVPLVLGLALGFGLFVAITVKLGAWVQLVQWGEEYVLTFSPVAGFFLGWWRFVVQLAGFIAIAFLTSQVEDEATSRQMTSAETEALPAYAQRAPAPEGSERFSDDLDQSEYVGRPNATYAVTYIVPATFDLTELESFLRDPGWAAGVDGRQPVGALQEIICEPGSDSCEAEVVPPAGEPVEHTVAARLADGYTVGTDGGNRVLVRVEIEYEQAG